MTDLNYLTPEKLKTIPLIELLKLKPNLDKAIEDLKKDKKLELIIQLKKQAEENGILLNEFGGLLSENEVIVNNKKPAKYKNQNDANQTWSGHGKSPKWIEEWKNAGNKLEDLLIKDDKL